MASIMIEVNRSLYMDELAASKTSAFDAAKDQVCTLLGAINEARKAEND